MTVRSLLGLAGLSTVFLVTGAAVLWACCPRLTLQSLLRLAGLAYLLGVASLGIVWTLVLVVGLPFGAGGIVLSAAAVVLVCALAGRRLGRPLPGIGSGRRVGAQTLVTALGVATLGLLGEGLFRAARLQALTAFDAWFFWIPKAKAIYYFGGLDEQMFTELTNPNYPPLLPSIDAVAFHAMGSPDVVSLHLLHWSYAVAFAWACAGLLSRRVPAWVLWPSVLLLVTTPRIFSRLLVPEADFLLDFFIATSCLLLGIWLVERRPELLVLASILLCASVCTKREGTAFAGTLLLAAFVASRGRYGYAASRLGAVALAVALVGVPWRVWYLVRDIQGEAPPVTATDLDRAWDALRLSTETILDWSFWGLTPSVVLAAVVLATWFGTRRLGVYAGIVALGMFGWGAFSTYSFRELELSTNPGANPIIRLTAGVVIVAGAIVPLLLASIWERHPRAGSSA